MHASIVNIDSLLSNGHAMDTHATIEELLGAVFSVWSVPALYNEDQLPLRECLGTAVRRERFCTGTSTVRRRYQAAQ
jgi:hypothetical protein